MYYKGKTNVSKGSLQSLGHNKISFQLPGVRVCGDGGSTKRQSLLSYLGCSFSDYWKIRSKKMNNLPDFSSHKQESWAVTASQEKCVWWRDKIKQWWRVSTVCWYRRKERWWKKERVFFHFNAKIGTTIERTLDILLFQGIVRNC